MLTGAGCRPSGFVLDWEVAGDKAISAIVLAWQRDERVARDLEAMLLKEWCTLKKGGQKVVRAALMNPCSDFSQLLNDIRSQRTFPPDDYRSVYEAVFGPKLAIVFGRRATDSYYDQASKPGLG